MEKKLTKTWDALFVFGRCVPGTRLETLINDAYASYAEAINDDKQKTFEINVLVPENRALRAENAVLKIAKARYEYLRQLSPQAFTELWMANNRSNTTFDDLLDSWIKADVVYGMDRAIRGLKNE